MMQNKTIVFEEISLPLLLCLRLYLLAGYRIYYMRLSEKVRGNRWLKSAIQDRLIEQIEINLKSSGSGGMYTDAALDNIETIYRAFSQDKLIKKAVNLYEDDKIELAFKKSVNERAAKFYYINEILSQLNDKLREDKIYFIPSNGTIRFRTAGDEIYFYFKFRKIVTKIGANYKNDEKIYFPKWAIFICRLKWCKICFIIYLKVICITLWFICRFILSLFYTSSVDVKRYKYAVMIVNPERQFANEIQKVDFLIDDKYITKNDMIFISNKNLADSHKIYLQGHNLSFIDRLNGKLTSSSIKRALIHSFFLFIYRGQLSSLVDTYMKLLVIFVRWRSFVTYYKVDNLISHSDFGIQSIGRNVILKKDNPQMKTWYYMHSIGYDLFYESASNRINNRYYGLSFIYYDNFVLWSDLVTQYLKDHHQLIEKYIVHGCLWSEHVNELSSGQKCTRILKEIDKFKNYKGYKILSIFDTAFSDDSIRTCEEGMEFLKGIRHLLDDMQNIFIILKEKKSRKYMAKYCPPIVDFYKKLETHPRCYLPLNQTSPSELIAVSSLTISFPFATPTFEALCARKKAIYYDASNKYRGTIFDKIPNLVCHGYDDFLKKIDELLFKIDEDEYDEYLNKFIKGKIESFLDGKAITRFKELLVGTKNSKVFELVNSAL